MSPNSHAAYVAWEIGAFGRAGVSPKSHVACVAWEIGAFGRVGVKPKKFLLGVELRRGWGGCMFMFIYMLHSII